MTSKTKIKSKLTAQVILSEEGRQLANAIVNYMERSSGKSWSRTAVVEMLLRKYHDDPEGITAACGDEHF